MTKSKGIGRGGSRKGAGRPRFAKTAKTEFFNTRINPKTRDLLEAEARKRGLSLSATAEYLLELGLDEVAENRNRSRPLRTLLFLIEKLEQEIPLHHRKDPQYSWQANPYMFAAFRAAILHVLNKYRPPGEIVTPPPPEVIEEWHDPFPASADEWGRLTANSLLMLARNWDESFPGGKRDFHEMQDVQADLNRRGKRK